LIGILLFQNNSYLCNPNEKTTVLSAVKVLKKDAEVAHLVEHDLAKVGVAGSSPVFRSDTDFQIACSLDFLFQDTRMVELVDTPDLKSCSLQRECGFNSRSGYDADALKKASTSSMPFFYGELFSTYLFPFSIVHFFQP
jgi:hypothetical protein